MREYIGAEDLPVINQILAKHADVRITRTSYRTLIFEENVRIARKKEFETPPCGRGKQRN